MSRKLRGLQQRLSDIDKEIAIAEEQLSTINDNVEYERQEKALNALYNRYDKIEEEIQKIESQPSINKSNSTSFSFEKIVQTRLISIDYCHSKEYFGRVSNKVETSGGAAALFLNEAYRLRGDILTQHIEDTLTNQGQDIIDYPIEFLPGEPKNQEALLAKILGYLGEAEPVKPEQAIAKICQSLQIGSIRVFKIHNWDELQDPYAVLKWFLDCFWLPLIECCQRHCQKEQLVKVQLFALIICQANDSEILNQPYYAKHDRYDPCNVRREESIVHLPLSCWTEAEIKDWMCRFPPPKYRKNLRAIDDLASSFYRRTNGVPINVVDLILKEYQTMEAG
ncbi:MAG: hypothetical protein HLUCCO16_00735 [Phormidium sp. OSCR]|nr:MAG: hypothetical protein HLUCCO16_00735 [Phormidium sp. OSCR]